LADAPPTVAVAAAPVTLTDTAADTLHGIGFTSPLIMTLLAIPMLGERIR
jgi:hypothetical protein